MKLLDLDSYFVSYSFVTILGSFGVKENVVKHIRQRNELNYLHYSVVQM